MERCWPAPRQPLAILCTNWCRMEHSTSTESTLNNSFYYVIFFTDLCKHTDARYCRVCLYTSARSSSLIHTTHLLPLSIKTTESRRMYFAIKGNRDTLSRIRSCSPALLSKWQWHAERLESIHRETPFNQRFIYKTLIPFSYAFEEHKVDFSRQQNVSPIHSKRYHWCIQHSNSHLT